MKRLKLWIGVTLLLGSMVMASACGQTNSTIGDPGTGEGDDSENKNLPVETSLKVSQEENVLQFEIELVNNSGESIELPFSSGQQFEVIVYDENDEVLYQYSEGKSFTMALENLQLEANESEVWTDEWTIENDVTAGDTLTVVADVVIAEQEDYAISAEQLQVTETVIFEDTLDSNAGVEEGTEQEQESDTALQNDAFRHIKIEGDHGKYTITGEARVFEAQFHYAVTDGHTYFAEGTTQTTDGAPAWGEFKIDIELKEQNLPLNGTLTLELYEESAKDGSPTNQLAIPLETFAP
ncbi:BsuPI-related putative proteinase inhibitor [Caldalkalibacillus salinus]|uniref:BsuPI-related putative proteinase inhibitor n=1 Tax=Caldalkalibacillus salinus TaxID=2803787 RepID=UPI00192099D6|nr:BsuPI-related putative proteinase inhibitor [Caldalkalibacillus salinus]